VASSENVLGFWVGLIRNAGGILRYSRFEVLNHTRHRRYTSQRQIVLSLGTEGRRGGIRLQVDFGNGRREPRRVLPDI
jgi:hypothetical protein